MPEPRIWSVDDATLMWCSDPLEQREGGAAGPSAAALEDAYAVLSSFISARCRVFRVTDPGLVDDVVHMVLERLARRPGPPEHARAFIARAVRNALIDRHRLLAREFPDPDLLELMQDPEPSVLGRLSGLDDLRAAESVCERRLHGCLARLDERLPGLGQRIRGSLERLVADSASPTPASSESELRVARRHRQRVEDELYEDLGRAFAYARSAPERMTACPSRATALAVPSAFLLDMLSSPSLSDDFRTFVELWLCLIVFRNRYRTRSTGRRAD